MLGMAFAAAMSLHAVTCSIISCDRAVRRLWTLRRKRTGCSHSSAKRSSGGAKRGSGSRTQRTAAKQQPARSTSGKKASADPDAHPADTADAAPDGAADDVQEASNLAVCVLAVSACALHFLVALAELYICHAVSPACRSMCQSRVAKQPDAMVYRVVRWPCSIVCMHAAHP